MVLQSSVDQGLIPRNVIALVERPADELADDKPETSKSWTLAEVERFRAAAIKDRLSACWLLSCYGLRRSEVLGIRWSALERDTLSIRRSPVAVGKKSIEGMPKSRRSLRELPLPNELKRALEDLNAPARRSRSLRHSVVQPVWLRYVRMASRSARSGTPTNFSAYGNAPDCAASTSRAYATPASACCWPAVCRCTS